MTQDTDRTRAGYEKEGTDVRAVTLFIVALAGTLIVVMVGMHFLLASFGGSASAEMSAVQVEPGQPPAPRLQVDAKLDLKALRENEAKRLETYGWINREQGIVHIPIDRAMDLLAAEAKETDK